MRLGVLEHLNTFLHSLDFESNDIHPTCKCTGKEKENNSEAQHHASLLAFHVPSNGKTNYTAYENQGKPVKLKTKLKTENFLSFGMEFIDLM